MKQQYICGFGFRRTCVVSEGGCAAGTRAGALFNTPSAVTPQNFGVIIKRPYFRAAAPLSSRGRLLSQILAYINKLANDIPAERREQKIRRNIRKLINKLLKRWKRERKAIPCEIHWRVNFEKASKKNFDLVFDFKAKLIYSHSDWSVSGSRPKKPRDTIEKLFSRRNISFYFCCNKTSEVIYLRLNIGVNLF